MIEIWKDIPGYEGMYQVSSVGRVKSLKRTIERKRSGKKTIPERILSPFKSKNGYLNIDLSTHKRFQLHRAVALAFLGPSENVVDHINGIKTDNRIENLEYVTYSENSNRAYKMGNMISGERRSDSKLTAKDVAHIRDEYNYSDGKRGMLTKLSKGYGICDSVIARIVKRQTWKHVR